MILFKSIYHLHFQELRLKPWYDHKCLSTKSDKLWVRVWELDSPKKKIWGKVAYQLSLLDSAKVRVLCIGYDLFIINTSRANYHIL